MNHVATKPVIDQHFISDNIDLSSWNEVLPFYEKLLNRSIHSLEELKQWMKDRDELESAISEHKAWLYIKMTCDSSNEEIIKNYNDFVSNIQPNVAPYEHKLNAVLLGNNFIKELDHDKYGTTLKKVQNKYELYNEQNIPLFTQLDIDEKKYAQLIGGLLIKHKGQELTFQEAGKLLRSEDRNIREEVYKKVQDVRLEYYDEINNLFDGLVKVRYQIAQNAGFSNYRDYKHKALNRFDYTPEDCFDFHDTIREEVVPVMNQLALDKKAKLELDILRPWDSDIDSSGEPPLVAFKDRKELLTKTINCFNQLDPFFGDCLRIMDEMNHFDLFSRRGKSPGGYNYPLMKTGIPFVFMNAVGTARDVKVMVHEGGHAIHSFLTNSMELNTFSNITSEVAELASMTMELFSMEHWDAFFSNEKDLKRAKRIQLEEIIATLPWVATIDRFQQWLYLNPNHTIEERESSWIEIYSEFSSKYVDWTGQEKAFASTWQKQLHIFGSPFYYIEYGLAQLGAVAMWRQFKQNREQAIKNYKAALSLGATKSIPEIYQAAGISFDFSKSYVRELIDFIQEELEKL